MHTAPDRALASTPMRDRDYIRGGPENDKIMRALTPDEKALWQRVTGSITRLGEPRLGGIMAPLQILNPSPSRVLDLHGQTVSDAFSAAKIFVEDAYFASVPNVTIITGKSGAIRREFSTWIARYPVQRFELLSGGGAFRLFIKKKPQKTVNRNNKTS
jgi:hypothetical protein